MKCRAVRYAKRSLSLVAAALLGFALGTLTGAIHADDGSGVALAAEFEPLATVADVGEPAGPLLVGDDPLSVVQLTTRGLLYLPPDGPPSFTDGWLRLAVADGELVEWNGPELAPPRRPRTWREYLEAAYPQYARRVLCIVYGVPGRIAGESGGDAAAWNRRAVGRRGEHASGLLQFLPSTMASLGFPTAWVWDAYRSVDAAAEMFRRGRGSEWVAVAAGVC